MPRRITAARKARIEKAREMWNKGLSVAEIADNLGCNRGMSTKLTVATVRHIRAKFHAENMTAKDFGEKYADEFDLSPKYLAGLLAGISWKGV